jgi:hypothetical protein
MTARSVRICRAARFFATNGNALGFPSGGTLTMMARGLVGPGAKLATATL